MRPHRDGGAVGIAPCNRPVDGVVLDKGRDGRPLTDPKRQGEGLLLPIGGAKGYGLALAIGLLAGVLNGAACGSSLVDFTKEVAERANTGQFVAATSVRAFGDPTIFAATLDPLFAEIKASTPLPGLERVRIPGEDRNAARLADGLPLAT